jgi:hypothetical protein
LSATEIFEFLRATPSTTVERHEVSLPRFDALRSDIRAIARTLYESDDRESIAAADQLRILVLGWLTNPIPFDDSIAAAIAVLGTAAEVGTRWGRAVQSHFERACDHARRMAGEKNPIRTRIEELLGREIDGKFHLRIFCDRRSRPTFESLLPANFLIPNDADIFLHSAVEYRDARPFDVLVKVGPLRPTGVGAVPDAIRTVPKFQRLLQVVWSGCNDDPSFGLDPCIMEQPGESVSVAGSSNPADERPWILELKLPPPSDTTHLLQEALVASDDFDFFESCRNRGDLAKATLIKLDGDAAILVPPLARVWGVPRASNGPGRFLAGETLLAGDTLILPEVKHLSGRGQSTAFGQHSGRWKVALKKECCASEPRLLQRLRDAGMPHTQLAQCVRRWCEPATTVVHAPKRYRDFMTLIRVLGLESDDAPFKNQGSWINESWEEIRRSRGDSIQLGKEDQRRVDEELQRVLVELHRRGALACGSDCRPIPPGYPIQGNLRVLRIESIEEGFQVPHEELHRLRLRESVEQWRD